MAKNSEMYFNLTGKVGGITRRTAAIVAFIERGGMLRWN